MANMFLPELAEKIIKMLNDSGFEAFAVGGCVRDDILDREPNDYDVNTNAKPEQIKAVFSGFKIIETGIKFGTVGVSENSQVVEITSYREDGDYSDSRRPDKVNFTASLSSDLSRRDFTVNALAYSPSRGLIDLNGGLEDIKNKVIRAIGDPERRFSEDALRIMRALRFASCLGFSIEAKTSEAVHKLAYLLENISSERIRSELDKLLCGKNCVNIIREYHDVISVILPELERCVGFNQHTKYHDKDVFEHTLATIEAIEAKPYLRLAMLLHDIGKPDYYTLSSDGVGHFKGHAKGSTEIADRFLCKLKYDRETTEKVLFLVSKHDILVEDRDNLLKRYMYRYGVDNVSDMIDVHIADDSGKAPSYRSRIPQYIMAKQSVRRIVDEEKCFSLKNLAVNGRDIGSLGLKGREIGEMLEFLLYSVIDGKLSNSRDELLSEAKAILDRNNERRD